MSGWSLDVQIIVLFLLFGNISTTHYVFIFHFPKISMNRRLKLCYIKVTCSLIFICTLCLIIAAGGMKAIQHESF